MPELKESKQRVKFYQTGTLTVGNRLLDEEDAIEASTREQSETPNFRASD